MTHLVKGLISLGAIGTTIVGGVLIKSSLSSTKEEFTKASFKERFSKKPNKVLLDSSGDSHNRIWEIIVEELNGRWDDSLPFKREELTSQKLKKYCSSLERESNLKDLEKFERNCSRNNFSSNYKANPIAKGSPTWTERKGEWTNGNFKPESITEEQIEEWCLNKGKEPATKKYDNDESSYHQWCLEDKGQDVR